MPDGETGRQECPPHRPGIGLRVPFGTLRRPFDRLSARSTCSGIAALPDTGLKAESSSGERVVTEPVEVQRSLYRDGHAKADNRVSIAPNPVGGARRNPQIP